MNKMSNEEIFEKFEEDCLLRDLSERTIASYCRVFDLFAKFSGTTEYASLNEAFLRKWLLHLKKNTNLSNATINQYNSACKFFLKIVLGQDIDDSQVPNSRLKRNPQSAMTVDEIREFFSHFNDITSFTYFLLLYSTGIRRSEALEIAPCDIIGGKNKGEDGWLIIRHGKGGHKRNVELPYETYRMLREYYKAKRMSDVCTIEKKEGIRTMPIFPTSINGVKADSFFTGVFNTVKKDNIKFKEYHPHTLRHSFAVHMLQKNTNNILRVQANLGHKSLATTEIYLRNAKLYNVENALSPAELAKVLCDDFYERTGL